MARFKIRASNGITSTKNTNKISIGFTILNTILCIAILLKLYGVI